MANPNIQPVGIWILKVGLQSDWPHTWQPMSHWTRSLSSQAEFCEAVGAPEVEQKRPMLLRTLGFKFEGFPQFFEVCRVVVLEGESCMTNQFL